MKDEALTITHSPLSSFLNRERSEHLLNVYIMERKCKCRQPSCKCNPSSHIKTEQGLAYTPAQMNALREKGIPISTMMVSDNLFYDGDTTGDMSYDPLLHRGVNEIDAWNMERAAKKNLIRAHKEDMELYSTD